MENKMTYKKILELIETVDQNDEAALDEIDLMVWNYKHDSCLNFGVPKYTRIQQAAKDIKPSGWFGMISSNEDGYRKTELMIRNRVFDGYECKDIFTPYLPTVELSYLHAVVQTIAYDRGEL